MANYRRDRINDQMTKEMSLILRDVKDPRVSGAIITVTQADVAADMKTAKIYYSSIGSDPAEVAKGLKSAAGFIRKQVASRLNLRITPELRFIADGSVENGARISELLKKVEADLQKTDDPYDYDPES